MKQLFRQNSFKINTNFLYQLSAPEAHEVAEKEWPNVETALSTESRDLTVVEDKIVEKDGRYKLVSEKESIDVSHLGKPLEADRKILNTFGVDLDDNEFLARYPIKGEENLSQAVIINKTTGEIVAKSETQLGITNRLVFWDYKAGFELVQNNESKKFTLNEKKIDLPNIRTVKKISENELVAMVKDDENEKPLIVKKINKKGKISEWFADPSDRKEKVMSLDSNPLTGCVLAATNGKIAVGVGTPDILDTPIDFFPQDVALSPNDKNYAVLGVEDRDNIPLIINGKTTGRQIPYQTGFTYTMEFESDNRLLVVGENKKTKKEIVHTIDIKESIDNQAVVENLEVAEKPKTGIRKLMNYFKKKIKNIFN